MIVFLLIAGYFVGLIGTAIYIIWDIAKDPDDTGSWRAFVFWCSVLWPGAWVVYLIATIVEILHKNVKNKRWPWDAFYDTVRSNASGKHVLLKKAENDQRICVNHSTATD